MAHIICGTYHCQKIIQIDEDEGSKEFKDLVPKKLINKNIFDNCILMGVDKTRYFINGEYCKLKTFSPSKYKEKTILVLTTRERHYLRVACGYTNIKIMALEKELPFLEKIKFLNDAKRNYYYLERKFSKCKALYGRPFSYFSSYFFNKIVRKIKKISELDQQFALTQLGGIQEVFKLTDLRENRKIITYDFNSMYPSCIANTLFPDPSKLKYKKFNCVYDINKKIGYGVYHVLLIGPKDEFIKKFHSIKYFYLTKAYIFQIKDDDVIETLLHTNEIEFYTKHFHEIKIIEGVYSEEGIRHPLANTIKKLYKRRLTARKNKNKELESYIKQQLTICCSSTKVSRKERASLKPRDIDAVFEFLDSTLGIGIPEHMPRSIYLHKLTSRNKFSFRNDGDNIVFEYPCYLSSGQVSSFSSYLFAEARVKMLNTLEYIMKFPECLPEICYVNVDSVHISVPSEYAEKIKKYMVEGKLADTYEDNANNSPQLGKLKLEHEVDKGIWLSPGRYWLIKDNKLESYVNALMNIKRIHAIATPVKTFDIRRTIDENLVFLSQKKLTIGGCLSFSKKLSSTNDESNQIFERFFFENIKDYKKIDETIEDEKLKSRSRILAVYHSINENYGDKTKNTKK